MVGLVSLSLSLSLSTLKRRQKEQTTFSGQLRSNNFRCYTADPNKRWELCEDLTCGKSEQFIKWSKVHFDVLKNVCHSAECPTLTFVRVYDHLPTFLKTTHALLSLISLLQVVSQNPSCSCSAKTPAMNAATFPNPSLNMWKALKQMVRHKLFNQF